MRYYETLGGDSREVESLEQARAELAADGLMVAGDDDIEPLDPISGYAGRAWPVRDRDGNQVGQVVYAWPLDEDEWDRQIREDAESGRLDAARRRLADESGEEVGI